MFDITTLEAEDTAILEVQNIKGTGPCLGEEGKPVTIEVYSPGSKQGVQVMRLDSKNVQHRMTNMVRGKISKNDAEEADEQMVQKLVTITKKINNLPLDPHVIYANPKLFYIAKQVNDFFAEASSFSKPSPMTSVSTSDIAPG